MKKTLKQLGVVATGILIALFASAAIASAQSGFLGGGAADSAPSAVLEATGGQGSFRQLLLTVIGFFLGFLGLVAVIMIIYAGVLYVTSGGDEGNTEKGKKIIMYAVIGLIIIMLSWAIVQTILGAGIGQELA